MECVYPPHPALGNYTAKKGRLVGFFREPDQRILSGYHDLDDAFASTFSWDHWPACDEWRALEQLPRKPLLEFANLWKGGMTYQLTGDGSPLDPQRPKMTSEDAREASRRVREGFAFVGITEEWDMSVCLFHKMFGGPCQPEEFVDIRPSSWGKNASVDYDTSQLLGFHDDIDEVVYSAALGVFKANLVVYNVSKDSCRSCFSVRGS